MRSGKDIVLFINDAPGTGIAAVQKYAKQIKRPLKVAVLRDVKQNKKQEIKGVDYLLNGDFNKPADIIKSLRDLEERILAVSCRGDKHIADFISILPFVPYLRTPTSESLAWSVDKIAMRQRFASRNKKITPKYTIVHDASRQSLKKIKEKIGFPLMIKPAGLGASLLVTICFHEEELTQALTKVFKTIKRLYKGDKRKEEPKVLVEEFMEGEMYSVDAYVSSRGKVSFCPFCHIKTGRTIGFDDFFGYLQMTPTTLTKKQLEEAESVAAEGVRALGLRSCSAHVELIHTPKGFKIIEIGPRIGGFRHALYELSYGFDHSLNDILVRVPAPLAISKKVKGYSAAMKFFAKKEGRLKRLGGIKKINSLRSVVSVKQNKKVGNLCRFAKNGGRSVCDVILFNPKRSELLADIRRLEKLLIIST